MCTRRGRAKATFPNNRVKFSPRCRPLLAFPAPLSGDLSCTFCRPCPTCRIESPSPVRFLSPVDANKRTHNRHKKASNSQNDFNNCCCWRKNNHRSLQRAARRTALRISATPCPSLRTSRFKGHKTRHRCIHTLIFSNRTGGACFCQTNPKKTRQTHALLLLRRHIKISKAKFASNFFLITLEPARMHTIVRRPHSPAPSQRWPPR